MPRKRIYGISEKEEGDVVAFAESLISAAIQGKDNSGIKETYRKGLRYWRGEHLIKTKIKENKKFDSLVYNKFAEIIDNRKSHILKARLKWQFDPTEESDIWVTDGIKTILGDVMWDYAQWDRKREDSVTDAELAGSTHVKVVADTETGYTDFVVLKNPCVFPDPMAKDKDSLRYIIHMFPKSIKEIEKDYDIKKGVIQAEPDIEHVKSGKYGEEFEYTYQATSSADYTMPNVYEERGYQAFGGNRFAKDVLGRAVIAEIWLEDYTWERIPFNISEVQEEHSDFASNKYHKGSVQKINGNLEWVSVDPAENHVEHLKYHEERFNSLDPKVNVEEMNKLIDHIKIHRQYDQVEKRCKYPRGRIITVCQGHLLRDEPNPLPIDWKQVFVKWDWFRDNENYWGKPATLDLFDPQDAFNHRKNQITTNINNLNNGVAFMRQNVFNSLFAKSKKAVTNLVGLVIPVNQQGDVQRDFGPPLPGHVIEDRDHTERFMDDVSGKSDLTAGRYPQGSPPAVTVDQLLGEAKTPLETILDHYAQALEEMARAAISIMTEFMDDDKKIRILGMKHYQQYSQMMDWGQLKDGGLLDIRISAQMELPSARKERFRDLVSLRQLGVVPNSVLITETDIPNKYEILQQMDEIALLSMTNKDLESQNTKLQGEVDRLSEVNRNMQMKEETKDAAKKTKSGDKD